VIKHAHAHGAQGKDRAPDGRALITGRHCVMHRVTKKTFQKMKTPLSRIKKPWNEPLVAG